MKYHIITILLITLITTNKTIPTDNNVNQECQKITTEMRVLGIGGAGGNTINTNLQRTPPASPPHSPRLVCPRPLVKKRDVLDSAKTTKKDKSRRMLFYPKAKI